MIGAIALAAVGLLVATVGLLGLLERLPMNRFAGVRTTATMRDAETFRIGNKVAGLPVLVAGMVGVIGGVLGLATLIATIVAAAGMVAITVAGGVLGHKAALAVPEPAKELPAGCAGCACGNCGVKKLVQSDVARVSGQ
ncbi:SdpI family protein [Actinocrispum wychmicini]|uniref:SdpI/YhfL family protein n=1 Tax=Actinocrispum wychmicini TaxID=1213861 RepID=A0A4R2K4H8_9PSEU|nr:SdpI/YhfL family protein [Actinocrispum wychmicini]